MEVQTQLSWDGWHWVHHIEERPDPAISDSEASPESETESSWEWWHVHPIEEHRNVGAPPPMLWPHFPDDYFGTLGRHYCRWGGSKSYKYPVKEFVGNADAMAEWASNRFCMWLHERSLQDHFKRAQMVELTFEPGRILHAWKYEVAASTDTTSFTQPLRVFHGTYPECLARIMHTRQLHPSDESAGLGMESHVHFPAVYTADTMDHAVHYSWPSNFLQDNLYYGVMLELEADSTRILKKRRGEVLLPPDALKMKNMYLLFNLSIARGQSKNAEWRPELELLPSCLNKSVGSLLQPCPLRRTAWHD